MRISLRLIIFSAIVSASAAAWAGTYSSDTLTGSLPLDPEGSVWIDNPIGNIEIIGGDDAAISFVAQKIVHGLDAEAIAEAREQTQILTKGDDRIRAFSTQLPPLRNNRWTSSVNYILRVPRTALVKIAAQTADHIKVSGLTRSVTVKNTNGIVILESVTGSAMVESVNGDIVFDPKARPNGNTQLSTVNGKISVIVPNDASFRWVADTIRGEFMTTFPSVSGKMSGSTFRGGVNGSRGPVITTSSLMGTVYMLRRGTNEKEARSVRTYSAVSGASLGPPALARVLQLPFVQGDLTHITSLGSVDVGQVYGNAHIETGAGEVRLGLVRGECTVVSLGGPLTLTDIFGPINARTKAGDILINAARSGGFVSTGGGLIRVLYAGGPMTLHSDGGDILVRTATGGLTADTPSGDISLTIDANAHSVPIDAKTGEGNVTLNVNPRFAADIEAVVITSDPDANAIHSDLNGLSFRKEQVGGRTRIRATGKVNGGGERVVLYAEEGDIHITAQSLNPMISPAVP